MRARLVLSLVGIVVAPMTLSSCDRLPARRPRVEPGATLPQALPSALNARIGGFFGPSYVVELRDGVLHYARYKHSWAPGQTTDTSATVTPSPGEWLEFREALDRLQVWRWRSDYPNKHIQDGSQWRLEIQYPDRAIKVTGSNAYPDERGRPWSPRWGRGGPWFTRTFEQYRAAVEKLLGGKTFR